MARTWAIVLGIGLIILGLAGLNSPTSTWIAWLDIVGGIISFFVAATGPRAMAPVSTVGSVRGQQYSKAGGLLFLCVGLFAMWIIGLATKSVTTTMAWWNFAFACAYGLLALAPATGRGMVRHVPSSVDERDQQGPRRVA